MRAASSPVEGAASQRPRRRLSPFTVGAIALAVVALAWLVSIFLSFDTGSGADSALARAYPDAWAIDYEAYLAASRRLVSEGTLYAASLRSAPFEPGPPDLFYYAPPLGVALLPLTDVPFLDGSVIWWALRIVAFMAACALMPVRPVLRLLAFAVVAFSLPAFKDTIIGNVSLLLLLPLVMGWRWMDRPAGSAALAVAISVRPMLGIFLVWQLLRRQWRAAAWTVGCGIALIGATLPFVGIGGYLDYLAVLGNLRIPDLVSENRDLGSSAVRLGAGADGVLLARAAGVALGIGAIVLSLRRDREIGFMVTLGASLLLSPLLWDHFLATLILPAAFLADRLRNVAIGLPLLAWLPAPLLPFVVILAALLPFLVADRRRPAPERSRTSLSLGPTDA